MIMSNNLHFLKDAFYLIEDNNVDELGRLVQQHSTTTVYFEQFMSFVGMFHAKEKEELRNCININGTGGSNTPKFNLTSIAAIYVAAISELNIVKTGSHANTGVCGSSDFFDSIGILNTSNKIDSLRKTHFAYYDYLELSPWKRYKSVLALNNDIAKLINSCIFFEYRANRYLLGISNQQYAKSIFQYPSYNFPDKIDFFYSIHNGKCVDEICGGDVFLNDKRILQLPHIYMQDLTKEEIIAQDKDLLCGISRDENLINYLAYSVAVYLYAIKFTTTIDEGLQLFETAYAEKKAQKLIKKIAMRS